MAESILRKTPKTAHKLLRNLPENNNVQKFGKSSEAFVINEVFRLLPILKLLWPADVSSRPRKNGGNLQSKQEERTIAVLN